MDVLRKPALVGALICLSTGAMVAQAQTSHVDMTAARARDSIGATLHTENYSEVRLLWIVTSGWLPASGVNVFRSDRPDKPLNDMPIKLDARALSPEAATKINSATAANKPLFGAGIATRADVALSSKAAFSAFKGEAQRLQVQPGVRGAQIAAQAAKVPNVVAYRNRLKPPQTVSPTRETAPLTDDEKTVSARIQVLLAGLTSYSAAQNLGLAFIDKTALPTASYTYILKSADAAGTEIARVVVPITEKIAPPTPTGLDAVQTGQKSIALHWEPISAAEEQALLGTTYNVYRDGKKLNKSPIRIPFLPTTDGGHIAPMTSFIDGEAPLGTVHYTVTMTDAFGRVSPASAVDMTMTDLRVPAPITRVAAAVSQTTPGALRIYWIAPDIYTGDIAPSIGAGLTQVIPAAITAIYRSEGGQPEITLTTTAADAVLTDLSTVTGQIPADILDLRLSDFVTLVGGFPTTGISDAEREQSVDKFYAHLNLEDKIAFYHATRNIRSYLDTTGTMDKDYRYHVVPGYTINPGHYGTGSYSVSTAIPTKVVPATPAAFAGTFQKGQGDFGFIEDGVAPKMRPVGVARAEIEQPRVKETARESAKALPEHKAPDKAPLKTIAGRVTLRWQAVPFSSKVRYRIFRAAVTGLFPAAQSAAIGDPPVIPNLNTVPKLGSPQRALMSAVVQQRHQYTAKYYANFPGVALQNYVLLAVTDKTQFVDTVPVSQRMHYDYRIMPISRWGVEGPAAPVADVLVPATLPPSLPTLLKTQVDENVSDGHVRLTISANPADENVAKYLVFRKSLADIMQAAQRDTAPRVRVASARNIAVPPALGTIPQSKVRNLSIKEMKANNSAILKSLLALEGYTKIGEIPTTATTFVDAAGVPRVPYSYRVVAVNTDSIGSKPSSPLDATAIKVHCDAPRNVAAQKSSGGETSEGIGNRLGISEGADTASVKLTWLTPSLETPTHYVLERSVERVTRGGEAAKSGSPVFVTLDGNLAPGATQFSDTSIRSGRKYTYRLCAVDSEGLFSEPQIISIFIPALAAANFGDPAPGNNPAPPNTNPTPLPNPTPTPLPLPGPSVGKIGTPKPATPHGRFGETYFITSEQQFAVRVEKAVYSLDAYAIDAQNYYYCRPNERFIKLTLRIKNTSSQPLPFDYQTVTAHTIGADDSALAETKNWKALDTGRLANRTVAPGQEFIVEGIVVAPADQAPHAISFGDCSFDLGDPANVLPALDASSEQPTALQAPCPLAYTVGTINSAGRSGGDYVVAVTVRNATLAPLTLGPQSIGVEPFDQDGDKYAPEPLQIDQPNLAPGATTQFRFVFKVPQAVQIKQIKLREKDSRVYVISPGDK